MASQPEMKSSDRRASSEDVNPGGVVATAEKYSKHDPIFKKLWAKLGLDIEIVLMMAT